MLVIVSNLAMAEPSPSPWLVGAVWHIIPYTENVFSPLLDNLRAHEKGLTIFETGNCEDKA